MVREELQREKLGVKAGKRAWELLYWEEAKGNIRKGEKLEGRERKRWKYFEDRGVELDRGQRGDWEGEINFEEVQERDWEIREGRYWEGEEERKCRLRGSGMETIGGSDTTDIVWEDSGSGGCGGDVDKTLALMLGRSYHLDIMPTSA
ncbi:hypothetical protein ALC57_11452 [Trachymyrmex cornetzi]|uniref:Uncharacterized protein n=1 Tax=Trachymyrmex cornetzi TaxID=471704 RepID=A0A151K3M5_9HYME|nr:hypothetical protein ALC57_11452 [Trachymyrmex cornetzi]